MHSRLAYFIISLSCLMLQACSPRVTEKRSQGKYSFYLMDKNGKHFIAIINQLDSGSITISRDAIGISNREFDRSIIVKDAHYYHLSPDATSFVKYALNTKGLQALDSIPMADQHIENKHWIDQRTLVLFTLDNSSYTHLKYWKIDVEKMRVLDERKINLPQGPTAFPLLSLGYALFKNEQICLGYCYNSVSNGLNFNTVDTLYNAQLSGSDFQLKQVDKNSRSAYPGGVNTVQSYSFIDKKGDFYFMSCPGIALGNNPKMPTAIFRIRKGEFQIDPHYFINVSESLQNHAYGLWELQQGYAIIRNERRDRYQSFADHHSSYHFEYHIVNLENGKMKKLKLPYDKGTRKESVWVENDKAYIAIDDEQNQHGLWIYDLQTKTIKKGLQFDSQVDFILRIDKQ